MIISSATFYGICSGWSLQRKSSRTLISKFVFLSKFTDSLANRMSFWKTSLRWNLLFAASYINYWQAMVRFLYLLLKLKSPVSEIVTVLIFLSINNHFQVVNELINRKLGINTRFNSVLMLSMPLVVNCAKYWSPLLISNAIRPFSFRMASIMLLIIKSVL